MKQKKRIVLLYTRAAATFAGRLDKLLRETFHTWTPQLIRAGDNVYLATVEAIADAQILILAITKDMFEGPEARRYQVWGLQFSDPADQERQLVPLIVENCELPLWIDELRWFDLSNHDEQSYTDAISALHELCATMSITLPDADDGTSWPAPGPEISEIPGIAYLNDDSEVIFTVQMPQARSANEAAVKLAHVVVHTYDVLKHERWISAPKALIPLLRKYDLYTGNTRKSLANHEGILRQGQQLSLTDAARAEAALIVRRIQEQATRDQGSGSAM